MPDDSDCPPFPRVLRVEPASRCNLACAHCPTGTVDMARGVMAPGTFARVVEELRLHIGSVRVVVCYHGGEPLLNRALWDMVRQVKQVDPTLFVKTVSNGMALTADQAERLIASGLDMVEFSLDGDSAEESQSVRANSSTSRIVANVQRLIALKAAAGARHPDIYIATTQFLRDVPARGIPGAAPVPAWLQRTFGGAVTGFKSTWAIHWPHMGDSGRFTVGAPGGGGAAGDTCEHVIDTMTIRADGAVVPCCYDLTSQLVMGNILDQPLADIWCGPGYRALRRSIAARRPLSICAGCAVVTPPRYLVPRWPVGDSASAA